MKSTRLRRFVASAAAVACLGTLVQATPASARVNTEGEFIALASPARILDTRSTSAVGPGAAITLQVTGRGGVPTTGVRSIVMNLTAVAPTSGGYLTVWPGPADSTPPNVSSVNFVPGQTVPNLVTVPLSGSGSVAIFNAAGLTHVLADVVGFYDDATVSGGWYNPLTPARVLDTRNAIGVATRTPVRTGGTVELPITGRGGVPTGSQVAAVVLNVTAVEPSAGGFVTVWPGGTRPNVSNLNFVAGQTIPNLVIVGVSNTGSVSFFNEVGDTHLVADVVGWFDRTGAQGLVFRSVTPTRAVDTRPDNFPIGADRGPFAPPLAGAGIDPAGIRAVVMNVTATRTTADSYFSIYPPTVAPPALTPKPDTSNLNWRAGQTVANAVMSLVSPSGIAGLAAGLVVVYNAFGEADLLIDTSGFFITPPA